MALIAATWSWWCRLYRLDDRDLDGGHGGRHCVGACRGVLRKAVAVQVSCGLGVGGCGGTIFVGQRRVIVVVFVVTVFPP